MAKKRNKQKPKGTATKQEFQEAQAGQPKKRKRRKKGSSRQKRLEAIRADIQNENTLIKLGQEPYYLHTNKVYADFGFSKALEVSNRVLTQQIVPKVKSRISKVITILGEKENNFYRLMSEKLSPYNFTFDSMRSLYANLVQGNTSNPSSALDELIRALLGLKEAIVDFQLAPVEAENRPELRADVDRAQQQFMDLYNKYLQSNQTSLSQEIIQKKLAALTNESLFATAEEARNGGKLKTSAALSLSAAMGSGFEGILSNFGERVVDQMVLGEDDKIDQAFSILWAASELGSHRSVKLLNNASKQTFKYVGASDILFNFEVGVDIGVSLKLRKYPTSYLDSTGNRRWVKTEMFGSNSTGTTVQSYNKNSLVQIPEDELNILMYGIINQKNIQRLSGVTRFRENMKAIFAWQKVLKAILGDKSNSEEKWEINPTLYIGSFDHLVQTKEVLSKINSLDPLEILSFISKSNTGNWEKSLATRITKTTSEEKKSSILKARESLDDYPSIKNSYVYSMYKTNQPVSYIGIRENAAVKNSLQQIMSGLGSGLSVNVKYRIPIQYFL